MDQTEQISGTVENIIFTNEENGFTVFNIVIKDKQKTTVKGHAPHIQPGTQVTLNGSWVMHPKFGKQFEAHSCTAHIPTTATGIKKYLASGLIKGIGPVYADKLVARFGGRG